MNPLTDVLPPQVRRYVYAVLALAALVWGCWQAADGNVGQFVGALITALVNATAASNTSSNDSGE